MEYFVVGLNHKTAPIDLRERLSFSDQDLPQCLKGLVSLNDLEEGVILSTCNRVEICVAAENGEDVFSQIVKFLSEIRQIDIQKIKPHLYYYNSLDAIRHIFRVSSSLDSMVVGETQIIGQVKRAHEWAMQAGASGTLLNRFFNRAAYVAKRIHTETEIATGAVSVGSVAVELAQKIYKDLDQKKVLLLGAGEVAQLVLSSLKSRGVHDISIINRSHHKALELAQSFDGRAIQSEKLEEVLESVDIVITSISGDVQAMTPDMIHQLMERRKNHSLFLIDLGVPRNIDSLVNKVTNVYLYNIDDLQSVVQINIESRNKEAQKAEEIVEAESRLFYESLSGESETIASLKRKCDDIRKTEIEKTLKKLSHLSEADRQSFEKCTEAIVSKILHHPIVTLKKQKMEDGELTAHELLKRLFRLDDDY